MMMSATTTTTMINRGGTTVRRRKESSSCSTSFSSSMMMKSMMMRSSSRVTTTTTTNAMCTGRRSSSLRIVSVRNRDVDEPALAVSTGRRAAGASSGGARARTTRARASGGNDDDREREIEEATKKWGLEVGLWKVFKSKSTGNDGGGENNADFSRMDMAKKLLKRYGSAYLLTSISLSLISITVFYFAVSSGIDVASLLEKVGINVNATSEQFGTFALAYAAHKASSPIRFGPTVALTPLVAKWLGKEIAVEDEMDGDASDGGDASSSD